MPKRLTLMITLIAALGVSVAIAGNAAQKEKTKSKDQAETKEQQLEKGKAAVAESPRFFAFDAGSEGGYLGVYLEEVTADRTKELGLKEERGALVMKVVVGSPAEKSGLKENDVVVSFNGRRVDSVRELQRLLNETPAERSVQIEIVRGGSRQTLTTALARRSLRGYNLLTPQMNDQLLNERLWKGNEEAAKRAAEALKRSEEAMKESQEKFKTLPRDFGDFAFVNPGEFAFFGRTRLGITAESLTDQLAEFFGVKDTKGVLVASVTDDSPASKAGIKAGDVIIAVDNQKVDSINSLMKALSSKEEGTMAVRIVRNRAEQTVNVTIEKRESPAQKRRAVAFTRPATAV